MPTLTVNPVAATVLSQLRSTQAVAHRNLDGITHEESLVRPDAGGNSLNWVVGHIIATRCNLANALGITPVWSDEIVASYRRGGTGAIVLPFDEILRAFDESHTRTIDGIEALSDEALAAPAPFSPVKDPNETLSSLLVKVAFHESYHAGQTGILRRVVGKPGAIE